MNKKKVIALFLGLAMTFTSVPAVVQAEVQETESKIVNLKTEGMVQYMPDLTGRICIIVCFHIQDFLM